LINRRWEAVQTLLGGRYTALATIGPGPPA